MLGEYLRLFASSEIFVFVFMEIVTKLTPVQRVIFKRASLADYAVFILLFGLFSIFGTLIGIPGRFGSIINIRDLAPIVAGLVAGPFVGLAVGLIGAVHRYSFGGVSSLSCAMATILAGLLAGFVFILNKEKILGFVPAMLFAVAIELIHGGLALLIIHPYDVALAIVLSSIPEMAIANSLGVGISMIIIHGTKEPDLSAARESSLNVK